ncbi:Sjogren's syndrome/scleroderma autoantigen 1 family protein [Halorubrum sp. AS12]|uniref:Sjogren's syndrome/scleroderma autoantigen 1 family protein n=1 Tax=Halorubrum sp. AS12 TaxID=3409687 RepID=UPI003DA6F3E9
MSDEFDKEAEREKLREKFAEDEKKREHTQRMSELLLKGATMTNRHCDNCGDPVFRHDGREFCPTCGNEAGGAAGEGAGEVPAAGGAESSGDAGAAAEGGVDAGAAENDSVDPDAARSADAAETARPDPNVEAVDSVANEPAGSGSSPQSTTPSRQSESPQSTPPQRSGSQRAESQRSESQRSGSQRSETQRSAPSDSVDDAEGIGAARASLTRTLTRFARAAEETDDPRRARDHLEAAREAAEALAALD